MSNAVFPSTLPGIKWGTKKSPRWSTKIQRASSGRELRASFYSRPLWRFSLSFEFLRHQAAFAELQTIVGFFNARKGSFDSFLYEDLDDNSVTDQVCAITVAGQTRYQLVKTYGGFVEPIGAVKGSPAIKLNGATQSGSLYTIDDNGVVVFNTAPAAGQTLSWTGLYYYRVRFERDEEEFEKFMQDLWSASKIEFVSALP